MKKTVSLLSVAILHIAFPCACEGGDLLFAKASRNYDRHGIVGEAYRRVFESRMLTHETWRQRLYSEGARSEANETIEIYAASDGSRWLSVRRAEPGFSPLIRSRPQFSERFELAKELDQIPVIKCESLLPRDLAREIELLWDIMLPGIDNPPMPRTFPVHAPAFVAFARKGDSITAGSVCLAAYGTDTYKLFVTVIGDLKAFCKESADGPKKSAASRLLVNVKRLTARLRG